VGSEILDIGTFGRCLYDVPDGFSCDPRTPNLIEPTDSAEYHPTIDAGCRSPLIDGAFRLHGDRNGADVLPFANEVSNDRVFLADLEVFHPESHQLSATQSASDEQRDYRAITFAA
jgi:hypothetical protein